MEMEDEMATQVEGPTETEKIEAPKSEAEDRQAEERQDEDEDAESERIAEAQRPEVGELGGESEYSLEEAGRIERGATRRHARGPFTREPLNPSPDPDELGRRFLENATEAPVDRMDEEEEPVVLPSDERE